MYPYKADSRDLLWTDLEIPGVSLKILHKNEQNGAMSVLTRLSAGATIPAHHHTHADETVYVLEGDFVEDGISFAPGSVFFGAAQTIHGPHHSVNGCLVLTHFSAELDFVLSEP